MLRNYLIIALRRLRRKPGMALINVGGLAIGLAACILIGLYVQNELSYDSFHAKGDRIYRVGANITSPDGTKSERSTVGWPVGRILKAEYPAVEEVVYFRQYPDYAIRHGGRRHYENMIYADSAFVDVFSFQWVDGSRDAALHRPYSLVLSEKAANKYFGTSRAVGETLTLDDSLEFAVTGVVRVPEQSHIQFDVLASFATLCAENVDPSLCESTSSGWFNLNVSTYVLLEEGASVEALEADVEEMVLRRTRIKEALGYSLTLALEPLGHLYARSDRGNGLGPTGEITYVYLLSVIALFILLIACINFMNLSTARSMRRATEVGVRKAVGAGRSQLAGQFLSEALLVTLAALLAALGIAWLTLPIFNQLAGATLAYSTLWNWKALAVGAAGLLLVGFVAGSYPALVLSRFEPARALRGAAKGGAGGESGAALRRGLVVGQFAISSVLIIGTLVVLQQLRYMQSRDVGFEKEQVLVVDARQTDVDGRTAQYETIKQELGRHPAVRSVSAANAVPGRSGWDGQVARPVGAPPDENVSTHYMAVDHAYVETFGLNVIAGRDFSASRAADADSALLVNEVTVAAMGWGTPEDAVGRRITSPSGSPEGVVIGVIENYHHKGLQEQIDPLVMDIYPSDFGLFAVRFDAQAGGSIGSGLAGGSGAIGAAAAHNDGSDAAASVLEHVRSTWQQFFPQHTLDYFFLEADFAQQYASERRLARIFALFAALAILIACLGLFGLAAFTAERRTKEIGIRKVLGASVPNLVALLSKEFLLLVFTAFLIAVPVAYVAVQRWLETFAYRTEPSAGVFALAGLLAVLVALATVSYQAIRAALADPVATLRSE